MRACVSVVCLLLQEMDNMMLTADKSRLFDGRANVTTGDLDAYCRDLVDLPLVRSRRNVGLKTQALLAGCLQIAEGLQSVCRMFLTWLGVVLPPL